MNAERFVIIQISNGWVSAHTYYYHLAHRMLWNEAINLFESGFQSTVISQPWSDGNLEVGHVWPKSKVTPKLRSDCLNCCYFGSLSRCHSSIFRCWIWSMSWDIWVHHWTHTHTHSFQLILLVFVRKTFLEDYWRNVRTREWLQTTWETIWLLNQGFYLNDENEFNCIQWVNYWLDFLQKTGFDE